MSFEQVSALNTRLAAPCQDTSSEGFWEAEEKWNALFDEVRQLIRDDPPRATELMKQLAHSESKYDREIAAYNVDELCVVDVEAGMELWPSLLVDHDVGTAARFAIEERFDPRRYPPGDLVYMLAEWADLFTAWHHRAEGLERRRSDPGEGRP